MNLLTIVVLAILVLFALNGLKTGLVRKLAGIVSLVISALLVSTALPYITDFLKAETPVYQYIVTQCEQVVGNQAVSALLSGGQEDAIDRDQIKSLMEQYGMDSSVVDSMSDEQLQELASQYFQDYLDQSSAQESGESTNPMSSMTKIEQTKLIQNLPIPSFLKEMMINYNNSEGYSRLDVSDFGGYVVHFFANIILNIVAFVVTLLVVQLVLWTGLTALDLFSRLPLLNLINRVGGLAVGIVQGLLVVWVIFLIISALSATDIGITLMEMVDNSPILEPIYDGNLFMKAAVDAFSNIM